MRTELDKNEICDRGYEWYESKIKHELSDDQLGMDLAIEVETGEYEIGDDSIKIARKLHDRIPGAQVYLMKHGYRVTLFFGFPPSGYKSD